MQKTIEAKEHSLEKVFQDDYLFEIPDYQRPYAWTTEETNELLDDLVQAMGEVVPVADIPPYFLGSIVLIKAQGKASAQVVDGQQRLTTLTILLCVLRELAGNEDERESLDAYIREKGNVFSGTQERYRLNPRPRDRELFQEYIQQRGALERFVHQDPAGLSDAQRNMLLNARALYDALAVRTPDLRRRLATFMVRRCYLVVVAASDQESAYRIFSVMNDRGLDLSPTDILKSKIIGEIPEFKRDPYTRTWEDIEEALGRDEFRELFSHIRMIYTRTKARTSLNQEFRDGVLKRVDGPAFVDEVLAPYAEVYQIVAQAVYESSSDPERINFFLRQLGRLDNYDWVPPAILFFRRHRHDPDALASFVRDLERLAYGLFLMRANVNERIYRYANLIAAIEAGADLYAEDAPLQLGSDECQAVLQAIDGPVYLQTRVRLPLLLRVDSLMADAGATYDHKVISVEHVLPQRPPDRSQWLQWFPDPDERERWLHRLANLVLLSRQKNTQAQNYEFGLKKDKYFRNRKGVAHFAVTSQVLSETQWTPSVLKTRQCDLVKRLAREWRLK